MGDAVTFAFDGCQLTAIDRDGGLWFPAVEVAALLGVRLCDVLVHSVETDGEATLTSGPACPPGVVISEPALYRAAFAAAPPAGTRLHDFVFKVVVPHMRGRAAAAPSVAAADMATATLNANVNLVRLCATLRGKAAANRLWAIMGLPDPGEDPHDETGALGPATDPHDAVGRFALEGIERVDGVATKAADLWEPFVRFCHAHRLVRPTQTAFFMRLRALGFSKRKERGRMVYFGIRPRGPEAPAE